MIQDTTEQKAFVIKTFYCFGGSCVAVERQSRRKFSVRVAPPNGLLRHLKKQSVCVMNARRDMERCSAVRTEEFDGVARRRQYEEKV
jgi:hypothetical protein